VASVTALADRHVRTQQARSKAAARKVLREWRKLDPRNIAASWRALVPRALVVVADAQLAGAQGSQDYVTAALAAQGIDTDAAGTVVPQAFSGTASDGRDLAGLLYEPAITTLTLIKRGAPPRAALSVGQKHLEVIARTQVADAGRVAGGVAVAAEPRVGYVRMLELPSCSRCVLLAGKFYRWSQGFRRHPQCDCQHIPAREDAAGDLRTDPKLYFESLSESEQNRVFTAAGAQAIRDGADMNQVVNARQGMYTAAGRKFTRYSTGKRGVVRGTRLLPEQIYAEANGNRSEAVRLLRRFGYLR
jgi:hypothetical protein